jgi:hypothetical protein
VRQRHLAVRPTARRSSGPPSPRRRVGARCGSGRPGPAARRRADLCLGAGGDVAGCLRQ